jgi:hypothetical protein
MGITAALYDTVVNDGLGLTWEEDGHSSLAIAAVPVFDILIVILTGRGSRQQSSVNCFWDTVIVIRAAAPFEPK